MEEQNAIVMMKSEELAKDTPIVKGYDFNQGVNYEELIDSFKV